MKGDHLVDDEGRYNIYNRWNGHTNTGTIAHLIQINNSLSAEIDIAAQATVTRTDLVYGEPITNMLTLCGDGSIYGNPNRNSDPTVRDSVAVRWELFEANDLWIGAAVNEVCRLARDTVCHIPVTISVKDPVALYMYDADFSSFLLDRTGKRRGNVREMAPVPERVFDWCDHGDITKNMGLHLRVSIPKGLKTDDNTRDLNLSDLFDQNNGGRYVHYGSQSADYIFMSVSGVVGPKPEPQKDGEAWPGKPQPALTYTEPYLQKPFIEPKVLGSPVLFKMMGELDAVVTPSDRKGDPRVEFNAVVTTSDLEAMDLRVEAKNGPSGYMVMPKPGPPNGPDYQSITPKAIY
ncbi:hypothetical protein CCUS01_03273 [Colletotrichum cuscutae]|uniref:Uncharacterized protein n=1 Tax=Colletotrichum cuscutae TaxID=1209917 RepID=A0AAI9Y9P5_9PEZI|nr:hypothetical protein CCUS01_03273 [Colletotrichum cuscutae]